MVRLESMVSQKKWGPVTWRLSVSVWCWTWLYAACVTAPCALGQLSVWGNRRDLNLWNLGKAGRTTKDRRPGMRPTFDEKQTDVSHAMDISNDGMWYGTRCELHGFYRRKTRHAPVKRTSGKTPAYYVKNAASFGSAVPPPRRLWNGHYLTTLSAIF